MKTKSTGRGSRPRSATIAGIALALVCLQSACAPAERDAPGAAPTADSEVLARIGDFEILRTEVESAMAAQLRELDQQRYELIEQGLAAKINERLVELAAEGRGMEPEAFLAAEVGAGIQPPSDLEVEQFYEQRKDQIGQPLEAVTGRIREFLLQSRRQEGMNRLLTSLRAEHEPEILLEPMRVEVAAAGSPSRGPASAPVTIVEFSDFQCPFCARVIPTLERVLDEYPESVRLVFRQFPLHSLHPQAQKAAEASLCAEDQGKFWEMHDAMFDDPGALSLADLKSTAAGLELDATAFAECLDEGKYEQQVNEDLEAGIAAGVSGTPALFINGRFLSGAQPYDEIAKVIEDELARASS